MACKHEFLVIVTDKPDSHAKRLEVATSHLKNFILYANTGICRMGGAILKNPVTHNDFNRFEYYGSSFLCFAESREELVKMIKNDVFATSGVWDLEKFRSIPSKWVSSGPRRREVMHGRMVSILLLATVPSHQLPSFCENASPISLIKRIQYLTLATCAYNLYARCFEVTALNKPQSLTPTTVCLVHRIKAKPPERKHHIPTSVVHIFHGV